MNPKKKKSSVELHHLKNLFSKSLKHKESSLRMEISGAVVI